MPDYIGDVKNQEDAIRNCKVIAEECQCACIIEKSKCKTTNGKKKEYTCYRGWTDEDIPEPMILDFEEWRLLKVKRKSYEGEYTFIGG